MRYKKGSVALSEAFDLPLLLRVRNARCIMMNQLCELLEYEPSPLARRRMAWRVTRLVEAQFLESFEQRIHGDRIYTITRKGLLYLEMCGHGLISVHSSMEQLFDPSTVMHWIDLVEIQIMLRRSGILSSWKSEAEVSSDNIEMGGEYAKDYDAVAALRAGRKPLLYGIEYERTTKRRERYRELRDRLRDEKRLHGVLYFVRDAGRLFAVAGELANAHPGILFCSVENFLQRGAEAIFLQSVLEPGASLSEMLETRMENPVL
jgi:hypothetical protein